ncbi:MAG: ATP-binding protein [Candidatus Nanohaloarchaea archaeon]
MKIEQVFIQSYGPLRKELELEEGLNVVKGPNESGKSLLSEAVLRHLSGEKPGNAAVEDEPAGYTEVSGREDQRLDGETDLTDHYSQNYSGRLRPEEIRNIFVINRGNLSFPEDERKSFYNSITDKLTGRRTEDIQKIKSKLLEEGRLTEKRKNISNKYSDAKKNRKKAAELLEELESYLEERKDAEVSEADLYNARERKQELKDLKEKLEKAGKVEDRKEKIGKLERNAEKLDGLLEELDGKPDKQSLGELEDRIDDLMDRQEDLKRLRNRKKDLERYSRASVLSAGIGAALGAAGGFFAGGITGASVAGVLGGGLPLLAFLYFRRTEDGVAGSISEIEAEADRILSEGRSTGLECDEIEELKGRIEEVRDEIRQLEKEKNRVSGVLSDITGKDREGRELVEESLDRAEEIRGDLEEVDVDYSEERLDEVGEELDEAEERVEEIDRELEDHRRRLDEFQREAQEIDFRPFTGEKFDFQLKTVEDLEELAGMLEELVDEIESDAEAGRTAIEVFGEIQQEEKQETAELFESGSRASEIFAEVTDDRYTGVSYDREENEIRVKRSTGEELPPEKLSEGTRDQLYLSIRVALGEELLQEPGFFLMDDALITSDRERLRRQAEMLEELADQGWQVIYLTSKEDAVEELSERSGNEVKELPPLE